MVEALRNLGIRLDLAAVDGDAEFLMPRLPQLAPAGLEPGEGAFFVRAHQARIAGNVGGDDRGELPFGLQHGGGG